MNKLLKVEEVLVILTLLSLMFVSVGAGLSGFSNYFENLALAKERSAVEECMEFQAPHALVIGGEIYCYLTIQGNEMVAPIKALRYSQEK